MSLPQMTLLKLEEVLHARKNHACSAAHPATRTRPASFQHVSRKILDRKSEIDDLYVHFCVVFRIKFLGLAGEIWHCSKMNSAIRADLN